MRCSAARMRYRLQCRLNVGAAVFRTGRARQQHGRLVGRRGRQRAQQRGQPLAGRVRRAPAARARQQQAQQHLRARGAVSRSRAQSWPSSPQKLCLTASPRQASARDKVRWAWRAVATPREPASTLRCPQHTVIYKSLLR